MNNIFEDYKKTGYLHHAHVLEGAHDEIVATLVPLLEQYLNIPTQGNPDFFVRYYESLGVDEARALKESQTRASFVGARKIFIISTNSFTREAQNALLKTFEEPTEGTHFFIILPRVEMLLPTLRSRVLVVSGGMSHEDDAKILAEKFIDSSLEGRFAMAKKMAEKKAGESVDRELFRRMLDHIERILYTRMTGIQDTKTTGVFHEIFKAKTYLADRGSSPKMLLEHVAIILT